MIGFWVLEGVRVERGVVFVFREFKFWRVEWKLGLVDLRLGLIFVFLFFGCVRFWVSYFLNFGLFSCRMGID